MMFAKYFSSESCSCVDD
ncbi:hypothetical protein CHF27_013780 [Romboutsia maritimum]|uniref:Uncharacterized protein n=1 Tax=Romboutsia maritimum TaxID=2020948 RepID=A0A371IPH9_9FIRM|nr:hypothetical protein CHF27_013780 [Romboutsia maritimum]